MRKRLLSALLAMAMVLTMLPTAAFAAGTEGGGGTEAGLAVSAYGFVWNGNKAEHGDVYQSGAVLPGDAKVGSDWMGQTMYVAFKNAPRTATKLWFTVTAPTADGKETEVWGCLGGTKADSKTNNTNAFSFLNRVPAPKNQWEQLPDSRKENPGGLKAGDIVTLKVQTVKSDAQLADTGIPTADQLDVAIFEQEIAIIEGVDILATTDAANVGTVGVAGLTDQADEPKTELYKTDSYKAEATVANGITTVAISVEDLEKHTNNDQPQKEGYWVGFSVLAPTGAAKAKYAFGVNEAALKDVKELNALEENINGTDGSKGIAFYTDADTETETKTWASVEWLKEDGTSLGKTIYHMDLTNVKLKGAVATHDVTFNANGGQINGENTLVVKVAEGEKLVADKVPTPTLAGKTFKGWGATANATTTVDVTAEAVTKPVTYYAIWDEAVTEGIAAGFGWTAAEVNTARDAAIKAAGKTDNRVEKKDALDQTVWFMVNEPVATAEKGNHYWYEITDGTKVLWEGAMDYEANAAKLGMISASFLHNGQNESDEKVPAKLVINVWKTDAAVTAKPATGNPMTQEITTGANPLKIDTVTPNAAEKTVKVTFNQDLLGRYVIELKAGDEVLKSVTTECVAPAPAVAKAEGYTFTDVTLAAGKYTVNVYQAKATTGAVTPAIDSKEVELKAETITEISINAAGLSAAIDGTKIVLTGSVKKANGEFTLTYKTSNSADAATATVTLTVDGENANWKLGAEDKLELFGTTYTLDKDGVTFLADNVEIGGAGAAEVAEIKESATVVLPESGTTLEQLQTAVGATTATFDANDNNLSAALAAEAGKLSKTDADAKLEEVNKDIQNEADKKDTLVVVPYLNIELKAYNEASDEKAAVLKMEITPMIKIQAVKGENDDNPVVVESGKKIADTTNMGPVVIAFTVPTGFVDGTPSLYVQHKSYIYTATYSTDRYEFTNPHGFSEFAITKDNPATVKVGDVEYLTLADAVKSVDKDAEVTITLLNKNQTAVTVDKTCTIIIAPGATGATADEMKAMLKAGSGLKVTTTEVDGNIKFVFESSGSSGGGTGPAPGGIGGGASGTTTYSVNVPTVSNGTVTVNPRNAAKDATVTITVSPNQGYHLESLTVTDKDGNTIELTKVDATKYTFKMPASRVEVKAVFAEGEAPAVSFTDVAEGEYYYDAVKWAVDKGVTNGLTETTFGPNASCTRAQMVTFLWRAAGSPEPTATTTAFTDIDANEYYYKAVLWAVEKGITTGTTETTFSPNATVTRAQTVTFLYRYAGSPAVSGSNNFTDLEAGEYYINAVQWAATNGITTGTTETTFSPANNCTRGQIVTFLHRDLV